MELFRRKQTVTSLGGVPSTRLVSAGTGLTGGGDLSADRTISLSAPVSVANGGTGVTAGSGQGLDNISGVSGGAALGYLIRTADATYAIRSLAAGTGLGVTNANGAAGDTSFAITDAELLAIAGLTSAANKGLHFTGAGTAATHDFHESFQAVTMTLSQTGATAGNATLSGFARRVGNVNFFKGFFEVGNTTTMGTGTLSFSFPSPFNGNNSSGIIILGGAAAFFDASVGTFLTGTSLVAIGDNRIQFYVDNPAGSTNVTHAVPWTWATGDRLWFTTDYPAS